MIYRSDNNGSVKAPFKTKIMTSVEYLIDWMGKNQYFIGNDLLQIVEKSKEMEKEEKHAEYMRGWKDGYSKNEPK